MGSSFSLGERQLAIGRWRLERRRKRGDLVVANEIAGQYEDNFNDIEAVSISISIFQPYKDNSQFLLVLLALCMVSELRFLRF